MSCASESPEQHFYYTHSWDSLLEVLVSKRIKWVKIFLLLLEKIPNKRNERIKLKKEVLNKKHRP